MNHEPELMVLGAGPAGIGASLSASACGVETVVVDSAKAGGGQVYRALPDQFEPKEASRLDPDFQIGEDLRAALARCEAEHVSDCQVWSVSSDFRVDSIRPGGPEHWQSKAIIAAMGATERVVPFPGWTQPGVIGLAATTILLKSQMMMPGANTVVAGCGPLLVAVAQKIVKNGGRVEAIVDLSGPGDWLKAMPAMVSRPADLLRGLSWVRELRAAKVPALYRHALTEVRHLEGGLEVAVAPVDASRCRIPSGTQQTLRAECVCVGHGLVPSTEVTRLLGAEHTFNRQAGGWVPILDCDQRTSRDRLYAAGDGTGISGAAAALLSGRIAGLTAALDLGHVCAAEYSRMTTPLRRELARAKRFGGASAKLMALFTGQIEGVSPDTVVCRCEDVTRGEIESALNDGACDVNQLKSWTRCGMGPCQGRMCGDSVAEIAAAKFGSREAAGTWTPRVPFVPLDILSTTGDYDYDDIPIPPPAPL